MKSAVGAAYFMFANLRRFSAGLIRIIPINNSYNALNVFIDWLNGMITTDRKEILKKDRELDRER